jgi:hypothetical protein
MTRTTHLPALFAGIIATLAFFVYGTPPSQGQSVTATDEAVLQVFQERVNAFAELHRRLAPPPASADRSDPFANFVAGPYLAAAIRGARPYAQQGDIFTPDVARAFRARLADSIGEQDGARFLLSLSGGETVIHVHPTVNETYTMTQLYYLPSDVKLGLPPIPRELDYRVASRDLVLWDPYAGIVVDFVPNAFLTVVTTE